MPETENSSAPPPILPSESAAPAPRLNGKGKTQQTYPYLFTAIGAGLIGQGVAPLIRMMSHGGQMSTPMLIPLGMQLAGLVLIGIGIAKSRKMARQVKEAPYPPHLYETEQAAEDTPANAWDMSASAQALYVPWSMNRSRLLRFQRHSFSWKKSGTRWAILLSAGLLGFFAGMVGWLSKRSIVAALLYAVIAIAGVSAYIAFLAFFVAPFSIYPTAKRSRTGTTWLCADGIYHYMPGMFIYIPWLNLRSIQWLEGDLLFQPKNGLLCQIPREAFSYIEAALSFHDAAQALWRSHGNDWPEMAVRQKFAPPALPTEVPKPEIKK